LISQNRISIDFPRSLLDPFALTHEDTGHDEQRFVTLGMGGKGRLLIVVWTLRVKPQRKRYENQF
jgi:uncharacterized DUF497 family protein